AGLAALRRPYLARRVGATCGRSGDAHRHVCCGSGRPGAGAAWSAAPAGAGTDTAAARTPDRSPGRTETPGLRRCDATGDDHRHKGGGPVASAPRGRRPAAAAAVTAHRRGAGNKRERESPLGKWWQNGGHGAAWTLPDEGTELHFR